MAMQDAQMINFWSQRLQKAGLLEKFISQMQANSPIDAKDYAASGMSQQQLTTLRLMFKHQEGKQLAPWDLTGWDKVLGADAQQVFIDQDAATSAAEKEAAERGDISGKLDAFYRQLMSGIPDNDPTAQYIQRHAANAAQAYGGRSGLNARSTLGAGAAAAQYNTGMQAYDFQRKQLATNVAGLMNNRDLGLGQLQQGWEAMQNQLAEKRAAWDQNQFQAIGSAVGGIGGAVLGGYFGGPMGAAAGGSAGSQFGGGVTGMIGGLATGGPQYRSYSGGSGGLGGRNPYTGW